MSKLLFPKELNRHKRSDHDDYASHHLINACGSHGERYEHQGWPTNVEKCRDGNPNWVKSWSLLNWSWIEHSFDTIQEHASEFSHEHHSALKVRMSEFLWSTVFIGSNDCIILHFHNYGITRSKSQHEQHDAIQLRVWNGFLFIWSFRFGRRRAWEALGAVAVSFRHWFLK